MRPRDIQCCSFRRSHRDGLDHNRINVPSGPMDNDAVGFRTFAIGDGDFDRSRPNAIKLMQEDRGSMRRHRQRSRGEGCRSEAALPIERDGTRPIDTGMLLEPALCVHAAGDDPVGSTGIDYLSPGDQAVVRGCNSIELDIDVHFGNMTSTGLEFQRVEEASQSPHGGKSVKENAPRRCRILHSASPPTP